MRQPLTNTYVEAEKHPADGSNDRHEICIVHFWELHFDK